MTIFLTKELRSKSRSPNNPEDVTASLKQQLLALHYSGTIDVIKEANHAIKQGEFLHLIISRSAESIRKEFSYWKELFFPEKARALLPYHIAPITDLGWTGRLPFRFLFFKSPNDF
jgi:hypothetical protein